jgi:hypothetical protein
MREVMEATCETAPALNPRPAVAKKISAFSHGFAYLVRARTASMYGRSNRSTVGGCACTSAPSSASTTGPAAPTSCAATAAGRRVSVQSATNSAIAAASFARTNMVSSSSCSGAAGRTATSRSSTPASLGFGAVAGAAAAALSFERQQSLIGCHTLAPANSATNS